MHLLIGTSYLFKLFIYNLPIYISSVTKFKFIQYNIHVEKKFIEVHYNMLVHNHVHYKYVVHENHLMGWWCIG